MAGRHPTGYGGLVWWVGEFVYCSLVGELLWFGWLVSLVSLVGWLVGWLVDVHRKSYDIIISTNQPLKGDFAGKGFGISN